MLSDDMHQNFLAYYSWARVQDPSDLECPHSTPERRLLGGGVGCEGLSDDEALAMDAAISSFRQECPEQMEVVDVHYRQGRSLRWMEKRGHGNRKALSRCLVEAHQYVRGHLVAGSKLVGSPPAYTSPKVV